MAESLAIVLRKTFGAHGLNPRQVIGAGQKGGDSETEFSISYVEPGETGKKDQIHRIAYVQKLVNKETYTVRFGPRYDKDKLPDITAITKKDPQWKDLLKKYDDLVEVSAAKTGHALKVRYDVDTVPQETIEKLAKALLDAFLISNPKFKA